MTGYRYRAVHVEDGEVVDVKELPTRESAYDDVEICVGAGDDCFVERAPLPVWERDEIQTESPAPQAVSEEQQ